MIRKFQPVAPGLALVFFFLAGCGDLKSRAPVTGKVTIEGKAPGMTGVIISFIGSDNQAVTAEVGSDGSFQASGVLVGENKVSLNYTGTVAPSTTTPPDGKLSPEQFKAIKDKAEEERTKGVKEKVNPVPARNEKMSPFGP